jgi:hypothetical protein
VLGTGIYRCSSCDARFICFLRFRIASPPQDAYASNHSVGRAFTFAWFAILAGFLTCVGIAFWTLRKFHRWPF